MDERDTIPTPPRHRGTATHAGPARAAADVRVVAVERLERRRLLSGTGGDGASGGGDPPTFDAPWSAPAVTAGLDRLDQFAFPAAGAGTAIAVIDSGIDYTHPHLGGGFGEGFRVVDGYDFVDDDADPMDVDGHGTAVAGILGASTFEADGRRMRGVAPEADLLALRVGTNGQTVPGERIELALRWVIDRLDEYPVVAVNLSLGSGHYDEATEQGPYTDELIELRELGVAVIAASGNDGNVNEGGDADDEPADFGIDFPAAHPAVWSVGATDEYGDVPDFTERAGILDFLAPGVGVLSTGLAGSFVQVEGTSFAAPIVAGLIASVRGLSDAFELGDVRSVLRSTARANVDGDTEFGLTSGLTFPQIDVADAVRVAFDRRPAAEASNDVAERTPGGHGNDNALVEDEDGVLHMVWFDSQQRTMRHATRTVGGDWSPGRRVDFALPELGHYVSIDVDRFGRPNVAYFDGYAGDLRFATLGSHLSGASWSTQVVDAPGSTGLYPKLVMERGTDPAIAYFHKKGGDLRLARRDEFGRWDIRDIDTEGVVGRGIDVEVDSDGLLRMAYSNDETGELRYAAEQVDGTFQAEDADDSLLGGAGFIDLALGAGDRPHISYYDAWPGDLKYTRLTAAGLWSDRKLATRGATGLYTQLILDVPDAGFADGPDAEDVPTILFWDRRSDKLNLLTLGDEATDTPILADRTLVYGGGKYITVLPTDDGYLYTHNRRSDPNLGLGLLDLDRAESAG